MGVRGPVPKRGSQRRRRNKESKAQTAYFDGPVKAPEPDEGWHPIARRLYESLAESGQAQFFEPSDWQQAAWLAHETSRYLESSKRSAMMFNYLWTAWATDLLATEGARRRAKLEIERLGAAEEDEEATTIARLDEYRDRVAG